MHRRRKHAAGAAGVIVAVTLSSCVFAGAGRVPSRVLELEVGRQLDERATETCSGVGVESATLIASADSTAGEIRTMYEAGDVYYPSAVDSLPSDDSTYAAICIFDQSLVADSSVDRAAYWVSSDSKVGGVMPLAMWNQDAT
jgi:hypothetical protein